MTMHTAVRLTVFTLDPNDALPSLGDLSIARADDVLLQVDTTSAKLFTAAGAAVWDHVPRDWMEQLLGALETAFATAPTSGFAAVVNAPTHLIFVAVWPWALGAGRLAPGASQ
jgi:hypothetical protein